MSTDLKPWKILEAREIFVVPGRLRVSTHAVELADGQRYEPYYRVELAHQAWVAALTDDGKFICQRQYKHGPQRVSLTLPGGIVDPGEEPLATAQRELLEETGYSCRDWQPLGSFVRNNNQYCGEEHFFWATGAEWKQDPDPTTNLEEIRPTSCSCRSYGDRVSSAPVYPASDLRRPRDRTPGTLDRSTSRQYVSVLPDWRYQHISV